MASQTFWRMQTNREYLVFMLISVKRIVLFNKILPHSHGI